jgi:hypothetical protein
VAFRRCRGFRPRGVPAFGSRGTPGSPTTLPVAVISSTRKPGHLAAERPFNKRKALMALSAAVFG